MLFTYADVDFPSFLDKWLKLSDCYSESFNIFFGIQYGPPRYIDMTFSLVAQSLMLYFTRTPEGASLLGEEERLFLKSYFLWFLTTTPLGWSITWRHTVPAAYSLCSADWPSGTGRSLTR